MNFRALTTGIVLIAACKTAMAAHPVFSLYTFDSPPYQYATNSPSGPQVAGETVDTVRCAMARAGAGVSIRLIPQNRARYSLERNLVDGYFAVDRSMDPESKAVVSDPVALEKWHWFYTGTTPLDPDQAKIGVVSGSNEAMWLANQGLKPFVAVANAAQLPALLKRKRIDLALMDQRVMNTLEQETPALGQSLQHVFLRYAPLHLYLNARFDNDHPGLLPQFNRHLPDCMTAHLQLSEVERNQVATVASGLIQDLAQSVNFSSAIHQGPNYDSHTDILTQDTVWQALAPRKLTPLAAQILELPVSKTLAEWQASHSPLVTEVLVINNKGALVAMSQLSSDYWQGDEAKFQEIAVETDHGLAQRAPIWISPIRYDASTSQFQVTVSVPLPLTEPNNGLEGVLSLGLAIESVMQSGTATD
ncbi:MAG TPA: transporter substrate-binding domain-containing protein [Marinobacter sp.]|nr:transporter substrate-binding domain-containing protein [Marinobacter sp.]